MFIDKSAGYQLIFPPGWAVVRQNHDEFNSMLSNEAITYPFLTAELTSIKDQDPASVRVHAFDIGTDHLQEKYVSHIYTAWNEGILPLDEQINKVIEDLQKQDPKANGISYGGKIQNSNKVIMAMVDYTVEATSLVNDEKITVFEKRVLFNAGSGTVTITISMLADLKDTLIPEYDRILDNIKLVVP